MNYFEPANPTTSARDLHVYSKDRVALEALCWRLHLYDYDYEMRRPPHWRSHWCRYDDLVQGDDGRDWLIPPKGEYSVETFDSALRQRVPGVLVPGL